MQLLFPVLSHYAQKFLFPSDDKIPMHGSPASHYDNGSGWLIPDLPPEATYGDTLLLFPPRAAPVLSGMCDLSHFP